MLGKTAGGLFWLFRYLERSENIARLVGAGSRIALTRADASAGEWASLIETTGTSEHFRSKYDQFDAASVTDFLLRDRDSESSVMSVISSARSNARLVRTALTAQVWEAINDTWMTLTSALAEPVAETRLPAVLSLIQRQSSQVRGALYGTMLRNDVFEFAQLGTLTERADNLARILDVKYYVLLPSSSAVGTSIDNVQWEIILRCVAGERAFRWLHGDEASARSIADFLILDRRMPRSLAFSYEGINHSLNNLFGAYGKRLQCHESVSKIISSFENRTIDSIFESGLHGFLRAFIADNAALAMQIESDYQFTG